MELVCRDCKTTIIIDKHLTSCPQCGSIYIDIYDGSKNLIYAKKNGIKEIKTGNKKKKKGNSCVCQCFFIILVIFILFGEEGLEWFFSWYP